jgi:large subunit ribosomal protein L29
MELEKIRNLGDEELKHQEKASSEQLFRLRFQVSMGQNDGVKKLRELRKEIAQLKTIARERELGIHLDVKEVKAEAPATEAAAPKKKAAKPAAAKKAAKPKTAKAPAKAAEKKTAKAKGARK